MTTASKIEWTTHTFNPWWGCTRVSPGCEHCYAETFAKRVGQSVWGVSADRRFFGEPHWNEPLRWNREAAQSGTRAQVFCASMADAMEDRRDLDPWRDKLYSLVEATEWLDWQFLTKRPQNYLQFLPASWLRSPRSNVWLGTTVEDQQRADERILDLLRAPSSVHFLSVEPLLGPVDLKEWLHDSNCEVGTGAWGDAVGGPICTCSAPREEHPDWVIVGGESGPGARPPHPEWIASLRDQCVAAGVAFFFKQWGEYVAVPKEAGGGMGYLVRAGDIIVTRDGRRAPIRQDLSCELEGEGIPMRRVGKKAAGALLDGRQWREFPA